MKQRDILKIGTFSILCYSIFKESHFVLMRILLLLNLKLQNTNDTVLLIFNVIVTGILPFIILIFYLNKSILKPIVPTLKNILLLSIILIITTFLIEVIDLEINQYLTDLERGEFWNTFMQQYSWTKGVLYLYFSPFILIILMQKIRVYERDNQKNKSDFLIIGISSVLCYLVFERVYLLLTLILTSIYTLLKIENEFIILSINIIFGLNSVLIFVSVYNRILKNKNPSKKIIYILLTVGVLLIFLPMANTSLVTQYFYNNTDLDYSYYKLLSRFSWSKSLNYSVRFLGLTYFIWKIYSERKTVANN
ncbi:hypothetical protein [Algibacter sp. L4_22]|uniref:hypothetical protein n=1 Tax=Algibacter sp. L4_22 TaxID=2942477 RepID=UPI00201B5586|nr:hypothetical protein [Algibacter sp. L4_22]MCL5130028.1 hypothetical protein [Algibacter sp. L4_22]